MRKTILRSFISFIIFALVVTSMGCVSPAGAPAGEGSSGTEQTDNDQSGTQGGGAITPVSQFERYSIPMNFGTSWNQQYWTVDRDGRTITEEEQFTVLFDVLTSEPQCMVLKRLEKRGTYENGENYNTELSAVFDMDGNLIIDWDEYDYYSGFGDFII